MTATVEDYNWQYPAAAAAAVSELSMAVYRNVFALAVDLFHDTIRRRNHVNKFLLTGLFGNFVVADVIVFCKIKQSTDGKGRETSFLAHIGSNEFRRFPSSIFHDTEFEAYGRRLQSFVLLCVT